MRVDGETTCARAHLDDADPVQKVGPVQVHLAQLFLSLLGEKEERKRKERKRKSKEKEKKGHGEVKPGCLHSKNSVGDKVVALPRGGGGHGRGGGAFFGRVRIPPLITTEGAAGAPGMPGARTGEP